MHTQTAIRSDDFRRRLRLKAVSLGQNARPPDGAGPRRPPSSPPIRSIVDPADGRGDELSAQFRNFRRERAGRLPLKVVSGSVRTYKILSDGRRQIGGFYLPGDIFGLEFADEHTLSAEAITDARSVWWSSAAQSPRSPAATLRWPGSCSR